MIGLADTTAGMGFFERRFNELHVGFCGDFCAVLRQQQGDRFNQVRIIQKVALGGFIHQVKNGI